MIVDVHTHTPTHRDAVPEEERQTYDRWNNGPPVVTTRSWAEYDEPTADADASIVFNIAVAESESGPGDKDDASRFNTSTEEFVAAAPTKRIGFMSVNPNLPGYLDEAERAFSNGLRGIGKLLFGSDFPVTTPRTAIDSLRAVNDILEGTRLPRISDEDIENIIHADALGALGLSLPRRD